MATSDRPGRAEQADIGLSAADRADELQVERAAVHKNQARWDDPQENLDTADQRRLTDEQRAQLASLKSDRTVDAGELSEPDRADVSGEAAWHGIAAPWKPDSAVRPISAIRLEVVGDKERPTVDPVRDGPWAPKRDTKPDDDRTFDKPTEPATVRRLRSDYSDRSVEGAPGPQSDQLVEADSDERSKLERLRKTSASNAGDMIDAVKQHSKLAYEALTEQSQPTGSHTEIRGPDPVVREQRQAGVDPGLAAVAAGLAAAAVVEGIRLGVRRLGERTERDKNADH